MMWVNREYSVTGTSSFLNKIRLFWPFRLFGYFDKKLTAG
jgi:hypothetical protein